MKFKLLTILSIFSIVMLFSSCSEEEIKPNSSDVTTNTKGGDLEDGF